MIRLSEIREFCALYYASKDTMHDLTHIHRIRSRAREIGRGRPHTPFILDTAAYFHGFVYAHEKKIRNFLKAKNLANEKTEHILQVAWESQKNIPPVTPEGKILHDAHLLEGDENFLITKCLVTGSARGQSLKETVDYFFNYTLGQHVCLLPENQKELNRRYKIAQKYFESLKKSI